MEDQANGTFCELLKKDPHRIFVIAEASLKDGGSKERALALVRAAKWAGADAVRFRLEDQQPSDAFRALYREAKRIELDLIATATERASVDFFYDLGVSAFAVDAGCLTDRKLIEHVGSAGRPVLFSTGSSSIEEITRAMTWVRAQANDHVILLHCASSPSAPPEQLNLGSLPLLRDGFRAVIGFSDYSAGPLASIVAAALGAQVIERPFVIETRGDAPELAASMDARTFKAHIQHLRSIGVMLGRQMRPASGRLTTKIESRPYEMRSVHGRRWQRDSLSRLH